MDRYRLVFEGAVASGCQPAEVRERLARLFGADAAQVARLFCGRPVTLKRGLGAQAAQRYRRALEEAGAVVALVAETGTATPAAPPPTPSLEPGSATTPASAFRCPKCGAPQDPGETCVACGIVFSKFRKRFGEGKARFQGAAMAGQAYERLARFDGLFVKQATERLEVFTGFETRNLYHVGDSRGDWVYEAEEVSGGLIRNLLHSARPFDLTIREMGCTEACFVARRPFRWYFHQIEVFDATGHSIGRVCREFSWVNRVFTLRSATGAALYRMVGPLWKPWTFLVERAGVEHARVVKRWSGLLREACSDADNFGVEFGKVADPRHRALLLAAVFLIDFLYFEDNQRNHG